MTRVLPILLLAASLALPATATAQARAAGRVAVVPVEGAPLARAVTARLIEEGFSVERGGSFDPPPSSHAPPLEAVRTCVSDGHALAFRLEFASAIRLLAECEARLGPALARGPEGTAALSALLVELAAAAIASGDSARGQAAFAQLARLEGGVPPDAAVHPPAVIASWEETRRQTAASRTVTIEVMPPWARVWVDGRSLGGAARVSVAPGSHYLIAEAAGHAPAAIRVNADAEGARWSVSLEPLASAARDASLRSNAGWSIGPGDLSAPEVLTAAFGMPVVMVSGDRATLFVPANAGAGTVARAAGSWVPGPGADADRVIARGVARALRRGPAVSRKTALWIGGAAVLGALGAGAAWALAGRNRGAGEKDGTVVWEP